MRKFIFVACLLAVCTFSFASTALAINDRSYAEEVLAPESYTEGAAYKLVRGISNLVTCPGELVKQPIVTVRDRGPMGFLLGPLKGVGMLVIRGATGVWETATFFIPNSLDGDFSAILKPEFVWTPSDRINH